MGMEEVIRARYPANFSEAEVRIRDRRCRCGQLAAQRAPGCAWHPATSADYARDLVDVLAAERLVRHVRMDWPTWVLSGWSLLKRTLRPRA